MTPEKIREPRWEVLMKKPYSLDLVPSDYHLFRSLQNHLNGKHYEKEDDIESDQAAFFALKSADFYKNGIEQLAKRWAIVVDNDDDYIVD